MAVRPSDLRAIPLFQNITDDHLTELTSAFERMHLGNDTVLFEAGSEPTHLLLLVQGEVALRENGETSLLVSPISPIGELGAVTGAKRMTTAVTTQPCEVWRIGAADLRELFEKHGDVAFPFYHNLVNIVADKVRRDTRRLEEMRTNLIRTQKAMKRMLEMVLSAEETRISRELCETLEDLIENNRRGHYMVEPAHTLKSFARLDGDVVVPVSAMAERQLRVGPLPESHPALTKGVHVSFVLQIPGRELPLSGTVEEVDKGSALVKLDLLIPDYSDALKTYLTRVQLLDFVV
jgi:CRP/FNR family transcriptional regulator, cyclic AMP receptor protein